MSIIYELGRKVLVAAAPLPKSATGFSVQPPTIVLDPPLHILYMIHMISIDIDADSTNMNETSYTDNMQKGENASTVVLHQPHCGGGMVTDNISAMPVVFIIKSTAKIGRS